MLVYQRVSLPKKKQIRCFLAFMSCIGSPKNSSPHSLFLSNIHSHPRAHLTWNTTDMFDSDPKIKNDGSCRSFPWSLSKPMGYLRISIILYRYPVDGFNPYACVWTKMHGWGCSFKLQDLGVLWYYSTPSQYFETGWWFNSQKYARHVRSSYQV